FSSFWKDSLKKMQKTSSSKFVFPYGVFNFALQISK
ncbi:MAG: hypothetical protein ACJARG_000705, partial [Arcticibacterium sp.]